MAGRRGRPPGTTKRATPLPKPPQAILVDPSRLPTPLAIGVMPPEDSKLWLFVPKALQQGSQFILQDTIDWLMERRFQVRIEREYFEHPRWIAAMHPSAEERMLNNEVVTEVHMAMRLHHQLPLFPDWVVTRMSLKQSQAELAYVLMRNLENVFDRRGKEALETMADRAPGQFVKLVASIALPKGTRVEEPKAGAPVVDQANIDSLLALLKTEMTRRTNEAKEAIDVPIDVEENDPVLPLVEKIEEIRLVTCPTSPITEIRKFTNPKSNLLTRSLDKVQPFEVHDEPDEINWDD